MSIQEAQNVLYDFANSLVGNRIFDLYLKYNGIKLLTTATLVPFALILGKDLFEDIMINQDGGTKNLPVIDDPFLGNILKIGGLTSLSNLTPETLIPIGVLMLIYNMYQKGQTNQSGGAISLTKYAKELFNNRGLDIFMKYQGLKMLSSTTLVPFALLYGRDVLEQVLQTGGGGFLPIPKIPFVDDPLFGNYIKLAGLSVATLGPHTLIPLGILMILTDTYFMNNTISDMTSAVNDVSTLSFPMSY